MLTVAITNEECSLFQQWSDIQPTKHLEFSGNKASRQGHRLRPLPITLSTIEMDVPAMLVYSKEFNQPVIVIEELPTLRDLRYLFGTDKAQCSGITIYSRGQLHDAAIQCKKSSVFAKVRNSFKSVSTNPIAHKDESDEFSAIQF